MSIYVFKVSAKHRKSIWRKIEIHNYQTLGDFDEAIKSAFNYDSYDHLSEFFRGKVWNSTGYGEIEPGGRGKGASIIIHDLKMNLLDKLEYVYDFGKSSIHVIELLSVKREEAGASYPRVVKRNKPKYIYCEKCELKEKAVALFRVYFFDDDRVEQLCESCMDEVSEEEIDVSDILY